MSGNNNVRAPYNFVPFHTKGASGADGTAQGQRVERVLVRYDSLEALPRHDRIDPKLLTGEIQVTMTAETPVFVSDGNKENPHFFRGPNGEFMLPGSTIRGMVRQNMQILGFGPARGGFGGLSNLFPGNDGRHRHCRRGFEKVLSGGFGH